MQWQQQENKCSEQLKLRTVLCSYCQANPKHTSKKCLLDKIQDKQINNFSLTCKMLKLWLKQMQNVTSFILKIKNIKQILNRFEFN